MPLPTSIVTVCPAFTFENLFHLAAGDWVSTVSAFACVPRPKVSTRSLCSAREGIVQTSDSRSRGCSVRWDPPRTAFLFERGGGEEYLLFLPRPPDDLHADWKAFRRTANGNHRSRIAQQVEEFRIAPSVEIVDCFAFNLPTALPVPESWDRRRRAQQDGILLHLREEPRAEQITLDPGIEQGRSSVGRPGPFQKLLEDRTKIRVRVFEHRT